MSFSVICSNCDRQFVDIDESLIGQQARCRCGAIVDLDPVWDIEKGKPSRPRKSRPDSVKPAKAVKSKKRSSKASSAAKPTGPQPAADRSAAARREKQPRKSSPNPKSKRPRPVEPSTAQASKSDSDQAQASDQIEAPTKSAADKVLDSYADLDQILAGGVDRTPLEPTRLDSPFELPAKEEAEAARPRRRGMIGAAIGGASGMLAAIVLLVTRVSAFDGTPLGWSGHAFYGTYTASYGTGEMTTGFANLLIGYGCWILVVAVLTAIASGLLLIRVGIRITAGHTKLAWSRGLLATLSVVCLFTLLGLLFLQTIHHGNLIRNLDSFSGSAPFDGFLEPAAGDETFHEVREKYASENTDFMIGVLTFAVLPLISFGGTAASLLFDEG